MYNIKVVNGDEEAIYPCKHINITRLTGSVVQKEVGLPEEPGYLIKLSPDGPVFQFPQDGQVAYIMNQAGDTIQTVRWPPNQKGGT